MIAVSAKPKPESLAVLFLAQFIDIDCFEPFLTTHYRRFDKLLTTSQFAHGTGAVKFLLEFLQGALDVFAFFYGYDKHSGLNSLIFSDCKDNDFFGKSPIEELFSQ